MEQQIRQDFALPIMFPDLAEDHSDMCRRLMVAAKACRIRGMIRFAPSVGQRGVARFHKSRHVERNWSGNGWAANIHCLSTWMSMNWGLCDYACCCEKILMNCFETVEPCPHWFIWFFSAYYWSVPSNVRPIEPIFSPFPNFMRSLQLRMAGEQFVEAAGNIWKKDVQ